MEKKVAEKNDLESRLKDDVHNTLTSFFPTDSDYDSIQSFFESYPKYQIERLDDDKLKVPKNLAGRIRDSYIKKLDKILEAKKGDYGKEDEYPPFFGEYAQPAKQRDAMLILLNETFKDYNVNVYRPNEPYSKIKAMAKKASICWEDYEFDDLSKSLADDCSRCGGSIVYLVSKRGNGCAFVRCFVGIDSKKRSYLFIDLIEGEKNGNKFIHNLEEWLKEKIDGAFKKAVITAV